MSELSDLRIVQPVPFFPLVRPRPAWLKDGANPTCRLAIHAEPMLYVPGILKSLDGMWLARCLNRRLAALREGGWCPDLIDAHFGYPEGVGAVRVAQRLRLPVFVTIRGSETEFLEDRGIASQLVGALNAATGCISVSHSLRRTIVERGVRAEHVRVIHNAVDRNIFYPADRMEARAALGVDPGVRLIVSVGHLVARKRHDVLVRAAARLAGRQSNVRLVIIGGRSHDRGHPELLERLVRELGATEQVRFLGVLDQATTASWLRAADVFSLATRREGCCNAVLEALATGTPVITTPVGDNGYFVRDGENGAIVPVGEVEAMESALAAALVRSWDRERISSKLPVGGWEDVARQVMEFFEERLSLREDGAASSKLKYA